MIDSGASSLQMATVDYLSGIDSDGTLAAQSFWTWTGSDPATYSLGVSDAHKWADNTTGSTTSFYSSPGTGGGLVTYAFDQSDSWTTVEQQAFVAALTLWSDETNIKFAPAFNFATSDILFSLGYGTGTFETSAPAFQGSPGDSQIPDELTPTSPFGAQAQVVFDTEGDYGTLGSFNAYGGYSYTALVHEVGHLLGLGHSGPYNDVGTQTSFDQAQAGPFDSRQWTVMSYINPDDSSAPYYKDYTISGTNWTMSPAETSNEADISSIEVSPQTPMPLDILAAQQIYGAPTTSALSGGQVFGFNCNITDASRFFFDFSVNISPVVTLWDAGSGNTLDLSGYSTSSRVNLSPGTFSSVAGLINNVGIAFGTQIDTAIGGAGDDTFFVNQDQDVIDGGGGVNTVTFSYASTLPDNTWSIIEDSSGTVTFCESNSSYLGNATLRNIQVVDIGDSIFDLIALSGPGGVTSIQGPIDGAAGVIVADSVANDTLAIKNEGITYWHAGSGDDTALLLAGITNIYLLGLPSQYLITRDSSNQITLTDLIFNRNDTKTIISGAGQGQIVFGDDSLLSIASINDAQSFPATITLGKGQNTLALSISENAWQGDAQFTLSIDGHRIDGTQVALAPHSDGQAQVYDLLGNFGEGPHTVTINYLNDAWGGTPETDRNLFVNNATIDGTAIPNSTLALWGQGEQGLTFSVPPITTADTLDLQVSEDAWLGDAQFTISINGHSDGTVYTATASHAAGAIQSLALSGSWGSVLGNIGISFINDAWGGTSATDRNLYVDQIVYNGQQLSGTPAVLYGDETAVFPSTGPTTQLSLNLAEDPSGGDAQYAVAVDGKNVLSNGIVSALKTLEQTQAVTLALELSIGPHDIAVSFLNNSASPPPLTSRSLYIDNVSVNGVTVPDAAGSLKANGTEHFQIQVV